MSSDALPIILKDSLHLELSEAVSSSLRLQELQVNVINKPVNGRGWGGALLLF